LRRHIAPEAYHRHSTDRLSGARICFDAAILQGVGNGQLAFADSAAAETSWDVLERWEIARPRDSDKYHKVLFKRIAFGVPLMKFTLTYDGPLSLQNSDRIFEKKWQICNALHPQPEELWREHPCLKRLSQFVPKEGTFQWTDVHHSVSPVRTRTTRLDFEIDLLAPSL